MHATKVFTIGALITALGAAPALAGQAPPYVQTAEQQKQQVSRAATLDKSEQIDALRRKDQKIQQLIDDLKAGRQVDPHAIDRALE